MRGRRPRPLVLRPDDVPILHALVRSGKTEQRVARRAHILLTMAEGERTADLATQLEQDEATVWRVCRRYEQRGLQAVHDAPRSGRPRAISPPGAGSD
jgi:transposase